MPAAAGAVAALAAAIAGAEGGVSRADTADLRGLLAAAAGGGGAREPLFWGLASVGRDNAAAWREHVAAFDAVLRTAGPVMCAAAVVGILTGAVDMELPG